jgi:hypothetical protein
MHGFITLKDLADMLGIDRTGVWRKVKKAGVQTILAPVMTNAGPQMARWIPASYALSLVRLYEEAKANSQKGI